MIRISNGRITRSIADASNLREILIKHFKGESVGVMYTLHGKNTVKVHFLTIRNDEVIINTYGGGQALDVQAIEMDMQRPCTSIPLNTVSGQLLGFG